MTFRTRDAENHAVVYNKYTGQEKKYEVLNVMEFTSARKRMSVVVRTPEGKIMSMIKGADSILIPLLDSGQDQLIEKISKDLDEYANEGLRTLILAQKEIDPVFFANWDMQWQEAMKLKGEAKENMFETLSKQIEVGYELIGCSAIEDKL
jgi:magnesium-transporting ATPase (P-type)